MRRSRQLAYAVNVTCVTRKALKVRQPEGIFPCQVRSPNRPDLKGPPKHSGDHLAAGQTLCKGHPQPARGPTNSPRPTTRGDANSQPPPPSGHHTGQQEGSATMGTPVTPRSTANRDAADRAPAASPPATYMHPYMAPLPGATVDLNLCRECGCPDGGTRHTMSARVPDARAEALTLRGDLRTAMAKFQAAGWAAPFFHDFDRGLARIVDYLNGLDPLPYLPPADLPETAQERQTVLPDVA